MLHVSKSITHENHLFGEMLINETLASARKEYERNIERFAKASFGSKFKLFPYPLLFPFQTFKDLSEAGETLFRIKKKILKALLKTLTPHECIAFLGLPPTLTSNIDWDTIPKSRIEVARHDFLVDRSGGVKFIEMFFGSPCSGSAGYGIARRFHAHFQGTDLDGLLVKGVFQNPDEDLARCIYRRYQKSQCARVVVLDSTHNWDYQGFTQFAFATIRRVCPDLEIVLRNEKTWPDGKTEHDLLYRILPFEDIQNDCHFQGHLRGLSGQMVTGFECEVLSSKSWFHILYDPEYTSELTDHEVRTIQKYIPCTYLVDEKNRDQLLQDKNQFVFKDSWSSGGRSVLMGVDYSTEALRTQLLQRPAGVWIAQAYIAPAKIPIFNPDTHAFEQMNTVFGIYQVDDRASGLLTRAHPTKLVVNTARGAGLGWALPIREQPLETVTRPEQLTRT